MTDRRRAFLTATWRHLVMLNYETSADVLAPFLPGGTELDRWNERPMLSLVGFLFLETRIRGLPVPVHRRFEEVNLRFYVRRRVEGRWRRAVVFIQEMVPRRAVAFVARHLYGEPYVRAPMTHRLEHGPDGAVRRAEYGWRRRGHTGSVSIEVPGPPVALAPGSEAEFVAEHYWGYTDRGGRTFEYEVAHPSWHAAHGTGRFEGHVPSLFGERFEPTLQQSPSSAVLADGSPVTVYDGAAI